MAEDIIEQRHTHMISKQKQKQKLKKKQLAYDDFANQDPDYKGTQSVIEDNFIDDVADASSVRANNEMDSFMKSVLPYQYEFIPSDNSLLAHEGEFFIDQVSKIYGDQIKALRREKLIERIANLENSYWQLADGVRARTINGILKSHAISYYS